MVNSKDIQKELESNYNIVLFNSLITKNNDKDLFVFSSNSITQVYKSSNGSQKEIDKKL